MTDFFCLLPRSPAPPRLPRPVPPSAQPPLVAPPSGPQHFPNRRQQRNVLLLHYNCPPDPKIDQFTSPLHPAKSYDSWGHSLPTIDPLTTFPLFLQNPNGLYLHGTTFPLLQDLQQCRAFGAAVLTLPETKMTWSYPSKQIFRTLLHRTWEKSVFRTSRASESFLTSYQPGSTAMILCNHWTSRLLSKGEDPMGLSRWSYMVLRGKASKEVVMITAYNTCPTKGDTTAHQQQTRLLSSLHRLHHQWFIPNPHRQFILDLQSWLEHLISLGKDIILAMDANEVYDPDTSHPSCPLPYTPASPLFILPTTGN